jgi:type IV pilus biogenesis protein PilP
VGTRTADEILQEVSARGALMRREKEAAKQAGGVQSEPFETPQGKVPTALQKLTQMRAQAKQAKREKARAKAEAEAKAPQTAPTKADTSPKSKGLLPFGLLAAKQAQAAPPPEEKAKAAEADRLTVFGARNAKAQRVIGGKPRFLGLMLTASLLLFLLAVAAWASYFLEEGIASLFGSEPETQVVETLPEAQEPAEPAQQVASLSADTELQPEEVAPDAVPQMLNPEEAAATYAATGIWQRSPNAPALAQPDPIDDPYVASIDPQVTSLDAVALPVAQSQDAALADPGLPPPADAVFNFDDRGLVRATPQGAVTPDGVRVFAGLPPTVAPSRGETTPAPERPTTDAEPEQAPNPLQDTRPQSRPTDLVEQRERASLGGVSVAELRGYRPVKRPKSAQETAQEEVQEQTATALAPRASLVPVKRPRNMAAIVKKVEKKRAAEAEKQATRTAAAAVAPRTVRPSGSVAATVSRNATVKNAINLSKVSLIGIYGTPSNRRALVRLPNGKYVKVKKGDRLDGGRVQQIEQSSLRYIKSGRQRTLKMPRG